LDYKLQNPKNTSKLLELNYMLEYKNIWWNPTINWKIQLYVRESDSMHDFDYK
jgi:hypothetical protein